MPELLDVTAPLMIRHPDGTQHIMAERFAHPQGILYFEPFWHLQRPASRAIHVVTGEITGTGPWKIGAAVVTVLGCQGTHPEMAALFSEWESYLRSGAPDYPATAAIAGLARAQGALSPPYGTD